MFLMTNSITIGNYNPFKCTAVTWNRNMDNYADSAKIKIPGVCVLQKAGDQYADAKTQLMPSGAAFKKGMPVTVACGYNGNNVVRFKGFVKQINYSIPLEIECEGYSFLLQGDKKKINTTYTNTTVKKILQDLVAGTGIKLSSRIPDIPVTKASLLNKTGVEVLDWLKENMMLTTYFNLDELYVGLRYLDTKDATVVNHRLGWNVVKDDELHFSNDKTDTQVVVNLGMRQANGETKKVTGTGTGNSKDYNISGISADSAFLSELQKDLQQKEYHKGYSGKLTCLLEPACDINMISNITDEKYKERSGKYVIESVEGSFDTSGGRQKIGIGINI